MGGATRKGLMQRWPLLTSTILRHARTVHAGRQVVSATVEGGLHRYDVLLASDTPASPASPRTHHVPTTTTTLAHAPWCAYRPRRPQNQFAIQTISAGVGLLGLG